MKDGTTHLAYKPEHALDTGVIVAIHPADQGDTQTLAGTLEQAMLDLIGRAPESPAEMVADTGYHSRVKALEDSAWKSPRKRRLLPAGTATTRLAGTTTGRG
jgi:transposase